eukprot:TRINITY_DN78067_c0_g1_i1.p1 TRINITY_DN78067_c0_g1~~TRINITY_DN78067_c0_g1_i1.p1  ORF type:complete len:164 (-),score=7.74 TRINITY_DN78067_c0_g1_i1:391-882(-)
MRTSGSSALARSAREETATRKFDITGNSSGSATKNGKRTVSLQVTQSAEHVLHRLTNASMQSAGRLGEEDINSIHLRVAQLTKNLCFAALALVVVALNMAHLVFETDRVDVQRWRRWVHIAIRHHRKLLIPWFLHAGIGGENVRMAMRIVSHPKHHGLCDCCP